MKQATEAGPKPVNWKWEDSSDSVTSYGALVALLALGNIPALQSNDISDLPYFIGLALTTVYIGSHRALTTTQRQQLSIKEVSKRQSDNANNILQTAALQPPTTSTGSPSTHTCFCGPLCRLSGGEVSS